MQFKTIYHFHIDRITPPPTPSSSPIVQFLLGITDVQREIEDNGYDKVNHGLCENGE